MESKGENKNAKNNTKKDSVNELNELSDCVCVCERG